MNVNRYYDKDRVDGQVNSDNHRGVVGGMWDEIGHLQFGALKELGLRPQSKVLDVGCGSFRLGRLLVDFLDKENYYGADLNQSLIDAGYERELSKNARAKLPRENLFCHDATQPLPVKKEFDFLVAFSLFTHLDPERSAMVLKSVAECMHSRSVLLATFFIATEESGKPHEHLAGITTYLEKDPFHITLETLDSMIEPLGLCRRGLSQFSHPRGQSLFALHY